MKTPSSTLVYSSESGRICSKCSKPSSGCICRKQASSAPVGDGVVRVARETKGRKGKGVTLINGVPLPADALKKLAKELEKEMIEAVRKLEFEKAALLRDQIAFLRGEGGEKKLQGTSVGGYKKGKYGKRRKFNSKK